MVDRLIDRYDGVICDLDGVVYRGPEPVAHAVEILNGLEQRVVYATNNASRTPTDVAGHLRDLGIEPVEKRQSEPVGEAHARSSGKTWAPSGPSGRSRVQTTSPARSGR